MAKIVLGIEYEGSQYCGWQIQPKHPSIQHAVESAIAKIVQKPVRVHACGRTDTGVHALNQVIHFDEIAQRPDQAWIKGVNSFLPKDIRVQWCKRVDDSFHARYSAFSRRYIYLIYPSKVSPGILSKGVTWCHYPLNLAAMQQAAVCLEGEHDFTSFRAAGCQSKTAVRQIQELAIFEHNQMIVVDISANAFLHHMVRNIVGALMLVGRGALEHGAIETMLHAKNRQLAPQMAPASGLYLLHAKYPDHYQLPDEVRYPWFLKEAEVFN